MRDSDILNELVATFVARHENLISLILQDIFKENNLKKTPMVIYTNNVILNNRGVKSGSYFVHRRRI